MISELWHCITHQHPASRRYVLVEYSGFTSASDCFPRKKSCHIVNWWKSTWVGALLPLQMLKSNFVICRRRLIAMPKIKMNTSNSLTGTSRLMDLLIVENKGFKTLRNYKMINQSWLIASCFHLKFRFIYYCKTYKFRWELYFIRIALISVHLIVQFRSDFVHLNANTHEFIFIERKGSY